MSSTTFLVSCEWVRGHIVVVLFQSRLEVEELLTIQHQPWTLVLSQNRNRGGGKKRHSLVLVALKKTFTLNISLKRQTKEKKIEYV